MIKSLLLFIWLWVTAVVALDHPEAQQEHDALQKDLITRKLAEGDPWPVGTNVYWEFDDGWYQGEITAHSDSDGYTITWSTGDVDVNEWDDDDVDQMVEQYQTMFGDDPWPVGTMLYWEFDDGWYNGSITAYNASEGYTITWSDGEVDVNEWSDDEVDLMVENYMTMVLNGDGGDDPWPVGTKVYWEFDDGWYQGEIIGFNSDSSLYSILWSNGDSDMDGWNEEDVDQMVEDYQNMVANDGGSSGMSAGAVFVIVAVSLLSFMGIVFCVCVRCKKKKTMQELRVMNHHYRTGHHEEII